MDLVVQVVHQDPVVHLVHRELVDLLVLAVLQVRPVLQVHPVQVVVPEHQDLVDLVV